MSWPFDLQYRECGQYDIEVSFRSDTGEARLHSGIERVCYSGTVLETPHSGIEVNRSGTVEGTGHSGIVGTLLAGIGETVMPPSIYGHLL